MSYRHTVEAHPRFHYEGSAERYPGITGIANYSWYTMILMAAVPYCIWQGLYFKVSFVNVHKADDSSSRSTVPPRYAAARARTRSTSASIKESETS